MTDTNSIFYRIGQSVKSTMNSQLDDYVPFSGAQSIDLTGSGNFGSLSVSGVPVVTGSIDTSNFALLNHDHDTEYASISHNHSLSQLTDVDLHTFLTTDINSDGTFLKWSHANSAWEAINHNQLGFAYEEHNHSLLQLNDVSSDPVAISDGQVLRWNSENSDFRAETLDFTSLDYASTDHVHDEYLDDSDLNVYSVTASAAANGLTPSAPAGLGGEYYTAMTADNQFIAISYTDDNGSETVGKVDIFKRNSDGTLSDRFSVDLGAASAALPIAIAKLSTSKFHELMTSNAIAGTAGDGGLILYNVLSYDGSSGQLAKAHYIPLIGDEIEYTETATDLGFITTSSFTERAHSISITENGEKIALGCSESDSGNPNSGRVFVYRFNPMPPPDSHFSVIRDYVGSTPEGAFGTSLSYRGDGDLLAVGAIGTATTSGAVAVIDDSDANYSAVSANLAAGESPYEYKFSLAIFSVAGSVFNDATENSYHGHPENAYEFIEITDLPVNDFFARPVLNTVAGEDVTSLSMVTANEGKVYSFEYHQAAEFWGGKGAPFSSTVDGSNAYSIDSSENGNTIVVSYNAFSSMSEFDFTGHQIKRFVYNSTTNSWDSGTIVASISDANASYNKFKSVLIASDGSFITTAMSSTIAQADGTGGLFRVYEYQNVYATREHNHALSALSDIDQNYISGGAPYQDGATLIWNAASGKWRALSNFLANKHLNDLSDVGGYTNASLTGGEVLQWSPANNQFEPATIAGADYSNGIYVEQFVTTPLLQLSTADTATTLASISAEESALPGDGNTVKIVASGGTVSIGDAGAAGGECDLSVTRNLTIGGNLTVNGTATTVNTTNLDVEDNIIKLNLNGGGNFESGGIGGSSGIEIEAGYLAIDGGNDRKARFVYNGGEDPTSADYGYVPGFFEATYEEEDAANPGSPLSGHLKMKVKGLEVENSAAPTSGFDSLGNYEDFLAGLNA